MVALSCEAIAARAIVVTGGFLPRANPQNVVTPPQGDARTPQMWSHLNCGHSSRALIASRRRARARLQDEPITAGAFP